MKRYTYFLLLLSIFFCSCKRYLDLPAPDTDLDTKILFENDATAIAAQLSIYAQMEADAFQFSLIQCAGLSSDEMRNHSYSISSIELETNSLTTTNASTGNLWTQCYKYIYQANAVLLGVEQSVSISEITRSQLRGEALFVRSLCHFYLAAFFGDAPYITSTDFKKTAKEPRLANLALLEKISIDLQTAQGLLRADYLDGNGQNTMERVRPNKAVATALLARVYLYQGKWQEGELASSALIGEPSYQLAGDPAESFGKASMEAVWQLMATVPGINSQTGSFLLFESTPFELSLQPDFYSIFAPEDLRRSAWLRLITVDASTYYGSFKYKQGQNATDITEYTMVLRLAEQFLIRAEARARQDELDAATADLNIVRVRAGLMPLPILARQPLLDSISLERRRELFAESGDRWLDLRRTGKSDLILAPFKGANWDTHDQLYPVPQSELNRNPNLDQNPGY